MSKTIVIVARQAGTASAFVPLFPKLMEHGYDVRTFAYASAHNVFAGNGVPATRIECFPLPLLEGIPKPLFLLTGTSEFADEDDLFWQLARGKGIPSLAFVDSWVFYWQRFTPRQAPRNRFACMPDRIAVIDRFMLDKLVESGCDGNSLIVTGSPAFDGLAGYLPKERTEIEGAYGKSYFLFVGEPFNPGVLGGNERDVLGYCEAEVLELAAGFVKSHGAPGARLVYRPHPRGGSEVQELLGCREEIVVDAMRFSSRDLVACSKGVIGMTSILLREAACMGVPAVSLQPNRRRESDVISSCDRITSVTASTPAEAFPLMAAAFSVDPSGAHPAAEKGSTLFDVIHSTLQ